MTRSPFYVCLIVKAAIANGARNWLLRNGFGPECAKRAVIGKTDPDEADPTAYATMLHCTPGERTCLQRKADELGNAAFVFWSMDRQHAKQQALAFIDSKGYRLKPIQEAP